MREVRFLGKYAKRYWWKYAIGIFALFVVDFFNTYMPQLVGSITDGLKSGTMDRSGLGQIVITVLTLALFIAMGRFCWRYFIFVPSRQIEREMRDDMFRHLERLSQRYFNSHKTGDLMAHFTNDLSTVQEMLGMTVVSAFDATVMLIMVLIRMVTFVSPKLTMLAIIPLLLILVLELGFGKFMNRKFLAKQEAFSDLTDSVQESVSGIRVIKGFVQEKKELKAFAAVNRTNIEKNMGVINLMGIGMPLINLIIGLSILIALVVGGKMAITGEITLGQFIAFNTYISQLVWPMAAIGDAISSVSQGMASAKRCAQVFDEKPEIVDGSELKKVEHLAGDIRFNHLTFVYPDKKATAALTDVDVHVEKGETLAVVGRTGSGKTTLVNLLERLYDVPDGMITLDGVNIKEIPLSVLRENIAYVPQDNFLFSDTLLNNISFGSESSTMDQVTEATKEACIHDSIMEFPEKYETIVGERGVTLSGGQKQRSSIARALLKDAPILILDDALSAVDTDTEEQILENLHRVRKGKTTIIIAHRISTIQGADHILVLDDGKMAEYGTHSQLMAMGGIYAGIYEKQQLEKQLNEDGENNE